MNEYSFTGFAPDASSLLPVDRAGGALLSESAKKGQLEWVLSAQQVFFRAVN